MVNVMDIMGMATDLVNSVASADINLGLGIIPVGIFFGWCILSEIFGD